MVIFTMFSHTVTAPALSSVDTTLHPVEERGIKRRHESPSDNDNDSYYSATSGSPNDDNSLSN